MVRKPFLPMLCGKIPWNLLCTANINVHRPQLICIGDLGRFLWSVVSLKGKSHSCPGFTRIQVLNSEEQTNVVHFKCIFESTCSRFFFYFLGEKRAEKGLRWQQCLLLASLNSSDLVYSDPNLLIPLKKQKQKTQTPEFVRIPMHSSFGQRKMLRSLTPKDGPGVKNDSFLVHREVNIPFICVLHFKCPRHQPRQPSQFSCVIHITAVTSPSTKRNFLSHH